MVIGNLSALAGPGDPAGEVADSHGWLPNAELEISHSSALHHQAGRCRDHALPACALESQVRSGPWYGPARRAWAAPAACDSIWPKSLTPARPSQGSVPCSIPTSHSISVNALASYFAKERETLRPKLYIYSSVPHIHFLPSFL